MLFSKTPPFFHEIWICFLRPNKLAFCQTAACHLSSFGRYTLAKIIAISARLSLICVMYKCKSSEICDRTLNVVLKIFFRAHLSHLVFLVVCILFLEQLLTFQDNGKKAHLFKPQPFSPGLIFSKFQKRY